MTNDGGPAFPVSTRHCEEDVAYGHQDGNSTWQFGGMTLRDYFAVRMSAVESYGSEGMPKSVAEAIMGSPAPSWGEAEPMTCDAWWGEAEAKWKYMRADIMLKAREAKK